MSLDVSASGLATWVRHISQRPRRASFADSMCVRPARYTVSFCILSVRIKIFFPFPII